MKRQLEIHTHYENGQPTHWPEMIACCLQNELKLSDWDFEGFEKMPFVDMKFYWSELCLKKCHNIVPADFECDPGDAIEFLAVTPDGDEFKFAPLVKCTGVQKIVIHHDPFERTVHLLKHNKRTRALREVDAAALIESEGYGSNQTFWKVHKAFQYTSWKLIHWTDKNY